MSIIAQLKTLLWKNFKLRFKKRIQLCAEILWPLFLFIVLIIIKATFSSSLINKTEDCFFEERSLPSAGIFSFFRSFYCAMDTSIPCFKNVEDGLQVHERDKNWTAEDELRNLFVTGKYRSIFEELERFIASLNKLNIASNLQFIVKVLSTKKDAILKAIDCYIKPELNVTNLVLTLNSFDVDSSLLSDSLVDLEFNLKELYEILVNYSSSNEEFSTYFKEVICNEETFFNNENKSSDSIVNTLCQNNFDAIIKAYLSNIQWQTTLLKLMPKIQNVFSFQELVDLSGIFTTFQTISKSFSLINETKNISTAIFHEINSRNYSFQFKRLLCGPPSTIIDNSLMRLLNSRGHLQLEKKILERFSKLSNASSSEFCNSLSKGPKIIRSLLFGKILYTPDNIYVNNIINEAKIFFNLLAAVRNFLENLGNYLDILIDSVKDNVIYKEFKIVVPMLNYLNNSGAISLLGNMFNSDVNATNITDSLKTAARIFNCVTDDRFLAVPNEYELTKLALQLTINKTFLAGLIFKLKTPYNSTVPFLKYKIRLDQDFIDIAYKLNVQGDTELSNLQLNPRIPPSFLKSGFIYLQDIIEHAFIRLYLGDDTVGTVLQQFPSPCYTENIFIFIFIRMLPLFMVLSWLILVPIIVKDIVKEKELKLSEFMKVMGLTGAVQWLAWFIHFFILILIPALLLCSLLKFGDLLANADFLLLFVFILLYMVALITQCFMYSVFFNHSNTAAAFSAICYFVLFLPYRFSQNFQDSMPFKSKLIACFSFTSAFGFGCSYAAKYEATGAGLQWNNAFKSPQEGDTFHFGYCILMIMIDIIWHILVTIYVEAVFPGNYGIAKPWYFPFSCVKNFFKKKKKSESDEKIFLNDKVSNVINEPNNNNLEVGISLLQLVKTFKKLVAVNNLTADFYKNQITGFLGHNGAGKTTTMSIITGLYGPTSGTVLVNNMDVTTQIKEIRKIISLCPQHNILYDDLTVMEHLLFYSMLKRLPKDKIKEECNRLLTDLNLLDKMNVNSSFLSGGMKRKLSVGIAYIGSPDVVVLDEPTAGVDAYARRSIWDLIQKYKNNRTTILSTHLMDEADILSDRLIIINKGQVQASGSIMFLKKHFGSGYQLNVSFDRYFENEIVRTKYVNALTDFVKKYVSNAKLDKSYYSSHSLLFILPYSDSEKFHSLFTALNERKLDLQFSNYGLSDTTLEHVFFEANKTSDVDAVDSNVSFTSSQFKVCPSIKPVSGFKFQLLQFTSLMIKRFYFSKRNFKTIFCQLILPPIFVAMTLFIINFRFRLSPEEPNVEIHPWLVKPKTSNLVSFLSRNKNLKWNSDDVEHTILLDPGMGNRCVDKKIHTIVDYKCYTNDSSVDLTTFKSMDNPNFNMTCSCESGFKVCSKKVFGVPPPELMINADDVFQNLTNYNIQKYLINTQNNFAKVRFAGIEFNSKSPSNYSISSKILIISTNFVILTDKILNGLERHEASNISNFLRESLQTICPRIIADDVAIVWFDSKTPTSMVAYLNVVHNAILRSKSDDISKRRLGMVVYSHPLNATYEQMLESKKPLEILPPIAILFALTLIPTSFLFFLLEDKNSGMMHLQYISGVNSTLYWVTNLIWDALTFCFLCIIFIIIFFIFDAKEFVSSGNILSFIILILMYGWAVIPLTYFFTWVFVDSNTGYIFLSGLYFLSGLVPTIVTFVIDFIPSEEDWSDFYQLVFIFIPQFCLCRGLIAMSSNYIDYNARVALFGEENIEFINPIGFHVVGKFILSLFLFGFLAVTSFLYLEILSHKNLNIRKVNIQVNDSSDSANQDDDVVNEEKRIFNQPISDNILAVTNLVKYYRHGIFSLKKSYNSILAVNNVTFGVLPKECFGLLGINGAGKTTLFKILTGDIRPTRGNIYLKGSDITQNIQRAQNLFGYCPQFDAICNLMTVKEHLIHFSRLRGASSDSVKLICEWAYTNLDLAINKNSLASHLSGGNKRKLSIALALIGSPEVIYLDEPTAGIDPKARKYVWECIVGTIKAGQSVVLTSHSLEECEFLCNRITIMVSGQLKCLGTIQHLKNKFNEGYMIDAKLKETGDADENYRKFLAFMNERFPEAKLREHHLNFIKFQLPPSFSDLSLIFKTLSQAKSLFLIDDYSMNQTKLEQIFMSFAKQANAFI